MIAILIMHPGAVAFAAVLALGLIGWVALGWRRRKLALSVFIMLPVAPLLIARALAMGFAAVMDQIEAAMPGAALRHDAARWIAGQYGVEP